MIYILHKEKIYANARHPVHADRGRGPDRADAQGGEQRDRQEDDLRRPGEEGGRLLDARALVSLALERRLADRLAPELRRQVFDALASSPRNTVSLEGGLVKIDLREPRREVATSLRDLRRARRLVVSDPEIMGGDPVFRGTRVPVHMIAELVAQGSMPAELHRQAIPASRPR